MDDVKTVHPGTKGIQCKNQRSEQKTYILYWSLACTYFFF